MGADDFRQFIAHAYWGRDKILDALAALPAERFTDTPIATLRSPAEILAHQLGFETFWLGALHDAPPDYRPDSPPIASVGDARERWGPIEARWRTFAAGLRDEDLDRVVPVQDQHGQTFRPIVRQILSQFVQHEGQHRSELALLASVMGSSPGEFDWWDFLAPAG